ncbi:MAG: phosphate signaling complex protein PhoU [Terriglobales bacterium]
MTRTRFHEALDELKDKLLRMGGLAEQAVERAVRAYEHRDSAACRQVFEIEDAINVSERQIDELALDLLAMQQPMASDLRFILAVIKINADLERVGDQAVNVAQRVAEVIELPLAELPADVPRMAAIASEMIRNALESFVQGDADLAESVLLRDNDVDRLKRETEEAMVAQMQRSPEQLRQALDVLLIARNLERVADHATNIAEDVIFWVRGADVRHHLGKTSSVVKRPLA